MTLLQNTGVSSQVVGFVPLDSPFGGDGNNQNIECQLSEGSCGTLFYLNFFKITMPNYFWGTILLQLRKLL